ncbi:MAG: hypothetical protein QOH49_1799 [Acidobacteriota bacterium]|jgi:YHS domain-containing protein|nr:hypothetical protein [Acidobacteriota bacterium]
MESEIKGTTNMKEEFVDPVCGMTVDPARAAGTSERDGVRYYFCSPGCKKKFDTAGESVAKAGRPLRLNFTRREASLCGEEVVLPEFGRRAHLPENTTVGIEITPPKAGEYEFTCGMNMYKGKLIVE